MKGNKTRLCVKDAVIYISDHHRCTMQHLDYFPTRTQFTKQSSIPSIIPHPWQHIMRLDSYYPLLTPNPDTAAE